MQSKKNLPSITIIGAGHVGYHLALAFFQQGVFIKQIFSRKKRKAQQLAKLVVAEATNDLTAIVPGQDLYILAVHDDAIDAVAQQLKSVLPENALVVHTSGACPSTLIKAYFRHYGVFYPLQSFSREKPVDWTSVPLCIYGHYKQDRTVLCRLAKQLSENVQLVDDEQRAQLHLAAVFVNNFTNFCYQIGHEITLAKGLPFEILLPLIQQTVDKIKAQPEGKKNPALVQTGPAVRGDELTISRHLEQLEKQFPQYRDIYIALTKAIQASKLKK